MYNRRIIINEDDRSRILNMHENHAKRNNLNFGRLRLNEAAAQPTDVAAFQDYMDTVSQTWNNGGTLNKGAGYGNFGPNTQTAWATYGDTYEQEQAGGGIENMSFNVNGTKMNYASDEELKNAVQGGQVTMDTQVWYQGIPTGTWTAISALPAEEQGKFKVVKTTVAGMAPDVSQAKEFTLSQTGSGAGQKMSLSAIDAAIKAGTINNTWFYVNANNQYESITKNAELKALLDVAAGPQSATQQVTSTGNQAVDAWLQTPEGVYFKTKTTPQAKEAFIDYLEKTGAGIIAQAGGKKALRQAALGAVSADTGIGRFGQRIKQGFQGAVQGFQGQQQA